MRGGSSNFGSVCPYKGMVWIAPGEAHLFWGCPRGLCPQTCDRTRARDQILKPIRRERRVANRRSNRPVAKIVLDRSGVPPIVGQLVAARVAQHMAADLEPEACRLANARNHALVTCHAQGRQALGGEHVEPRLPLPLQAAQGA